MAQTHSPSPLFSPSPAHSIFSNDYNDPPISYERSRRTPHPHNSSQGPRLDYSRNSSNPSSSQQRPNLLHQASRTVVVDLTEDVDDMLPIRARPHPSSRTILHSSADSAAMTEIVDLTDDDELVVTGMRPLSRNNQQPPMFQRRFPVIEARARHAQAHTHANAQASNANGPRPIAGRPNFANYYNPHNIGHAYLHDNNILQSDLINSAVVRDLPLPGNLQQQRMLLNIGHFDYTAHAFAAPVRPVATAEPEYVAPPPVPEGFTRTPDQEDVAICPGCEEELVAHKIDGDYVSTKTKKSGKAPTKTEREQHPFWVIKECGHVFCNSCFQNRAGKTKLPSKFPSATSSEGTKSKPKRRCAVEGCESEINNKSDWVGVFL